MGYDDLSGHAESTTQTGVAPKAGIKSEAGGATKAGAKEVSAKRLNLQVPELQENMQTSLEPVSDLMK